MKRFFLLVLLVLLSLLIFAQELHFDWIEAVPDTIYADNNITFSEITVRVVDEDQNPVENIWIDFQTDIGNIIHLTSTDENGLADTTFWDNEDVGTAHIFASISDDEIEVEVVILPVVHLVDEQVNLTNFTITPNPLNFGKHGRINLKFSLKRKQQVNMKIYNLRGQLIDTILDKQFQPGNHTKSHNLSNRKFSTGIYFITFQSKKEKYSRKLTIY